MVESYRMQEVRVDLVRMRLRKGGVEKEDKRVMPARSDLRRKRKAEKDAGDLRGQMLDQAEIEKRARIEVLALLGLSEEVAVEVRKKKTLIPSQERNRVIELARLKRLWKKTS